MSDSTNYKAPMHHLNPKFKELLLSLKGTAMSEFNIQISTDKMIQDKSYRDIVIDELSYLNSKTLNVYIQLLQKTPVYIKSSTQEFSLDALPSLPKTDKNTQQNPLKHREKAPQKSKKIWLFSLLVICLSLFITWQNGYLQLSLMSQNLFAGQNNPTIAPSLDPITENTEALITENTEKSKYPSRTEQETTETQQIPAVAPAAVIKTTPTLPSENRIVKLRLHGSNTIGENLAPALLEAYLKSLGVKTMQWVQGKHLVERELQYIKDDQVYAVELHAHGSSTGFQDLLDDQADMAMSSRKIHEKEVQLLRPLYGDLAHAGQENIIGLDGLAIIVSPNNPVNSLSSATLAKVFSGEINNWEVLGGEDLPIKIYARDENSGTWDTFKSLVLKANHKKLISSAIRLESSSELSEEVSKDPGAIGFIGLPYINSSKAISIAASANTTPIYPTRFTVSTEDYPLSRRLYMYTPTLANQMVSAFTHFVVSHAGQDIVEQVGLISQNIKQETIYKIKGAPQIYNNYTEMAKRLSVNFRFTSGSNELDNKGQHDLLRLVDYMATQQGRRIVLMGFSDSLGTKERNLQLSILRARMLEKALTARGLNVVAVEGFGELLPIASNQNELGRSKNRRVEVWIF